MSFGKYLAERLGVEIEEVETVKVRVGRVSQELKAEFEANDNAHNAEHEALKARINAFIEQVQAEHSCKKFNDQEADLWERLYDELGLTEAERGHNYTIKDSSRAVYRIDEVEEAEAKININKLQ
jgi:hypothetical protein